MNKRDLKILTKAQLIRLLLKQEKNRQVQKPSDTINKPIPPPRTGKWERVKPKPIPTKNVKQIVNNYEDNPATRTIPGWIQANSSSSDQN